METPMSVCSMDTDQLKRDIMSHRDNISEASLSHNVNAYCGEPMPTPINNGAFSFRRMTPADTPVSYASISASQVVLFENPLISWAVFGAGATSLAVCHFLLSGHHSITLLSAIAYSLLALLGFNFARSLFSRSAPAGVHKSRLLSALSSWCLAGLDAAATLHDRYLAAQDPTRSLRVGLALWGLALAGRYLSITWTLSLLFVAAFALPLQYRRHQETLHRASGGILSTVQNRFARLGLSRRQKGLVLAVFLCALWLKAAWSTRLSTLLLGILAVRCQLKPTEVEAFMATAEPYTMSVRKKARSFHAAAADFAQRRLGPASAFKLRRQD